MLRNDFKGLSLPRLGFGAMRLPTLEGGEIDNEEMQKMVDYAMENGVNYFDTAYPYHGGKSEIALAEALSKYPRESYFLADKYPGHQLMEVQEPERIFADQLKKCGTDYFDFYLLHNVNEKSVEIYTDPKWGIIDYFVEQKKMGKIRHLGFSAHARIDCLREFLDKYGEHMEFCQIQMNYLDYTLQMAKEKYELLTERGIAVWVMEPVRGGKLASLMPSAEESLRECNSGVSVASWGFRWLLGFPNVKVILSGMSNFAQIKDNVKTFSNYEKLTEREENLLYEIAEAMKKSVPCTSCRYCTPGCPMGLDIPLFMATYNELSFMLGVNSAMAVQFLEENKQPTACVTCGRCARVCPQNIDIPLVIRNLCRLLESVPSWRDICKEREEAERRLAKERENTGKT